MIWELWFVAGEGVILRKHLMNYERFASALVYKAKNFLEPAGLPHASTTTPSLMVFSFICIRS